MLRKLLDWLQKVLRFFFGPDNLGLIHRVFQDTMACGVMGFLFYHFAPWFLRLVGVTHTIVAAAHDIIVVSSIIAWVAKVLIRLVQWIRKKDD